MKILQKIRAIFNFKGMKAEMELKSAEVRGSKVFLHPVDDPDHTFCVSGKAIDILINPAIELREDDFMVLDNKKLAKLEPAKDIDPTASIEKIVQPKMPPAEKQPSKTQESQTNLPKVQPGPKADAASNTDPKAESVPGEKKVREQSVVPKSNVAHSYELPKMRTVSMRLYQDEYDLLMEAIQSNGYKKTEYLLACVAAAKKKSMESNYQKYYADRMRRRKEQREAAKQAMKESNSA